MLDCSSDHWLADFLIVDMASGARRGELLALTWRDVGPECTSVTIRASLEQTKTGLRVKETKGRNVRTVPLPPEAIEALKRAKASRDENRKLLGPDYLTDLDLVFCHPSGDYIRPDTVTKAVRRLAKKAGFTRVSLHNLRHSYGSQLLAAGVPLAVVSKFLGHSSVLVTANIYAHALASDESAAAGKWEAAMQRARGSKVVEIAVKEKRA